MRSVLLTSGWARKGFFAQIVAARLCMCRGGLGWERWTLSTSRQGQSPLASCQVRTGTRAILTSALVQTPLAKCAGDLLWFWGLSTSKIHTLGSPCFCHQEDWSDWSFYCSPVAFEQAGRESSPGGQVRRKVPSETPQVSGLPFFPDQLGGREGASREAAGIQILWLIF